MCRTAGLSRISLPVSHEDTAQVTINTASMLRVIHIQSITTKLAQPFSPLMDANAGLIMKGYRKCDYAK